jgi:prephenate dehydratase
LEINHCLVSLEDNISDVKTVISHPQALDQTYHYMKSHNMVRENFYDTAGAAKHISENNVRKYGAMSSKLAAAIYNLNILEEGVQDQSGNTTRFLVICLNKEVKKYNYKEKKNKISLLIEARHIPASLYKCLGAFATNNVNLTKIENLPSF